MLAVVEINDKQHLVKEGDIFSVDGNIESNKITFKTVLLTVNNKTTNIGQPYVENASVDAELIESGKEDKKIVFKFKRKTGYKVLKGHRQNSSLIKIKKINFESKTGETKAKKEATTTSKAKPKTTKKTVKSNSGEK